MRPAFRMPGMPEWDRTEFLVHKHHCDQGEYEGSCKYGEKDCPTLARSTRPPEDPE